MVAAPELWQVCHGVAAILLYFLAERFIGDPKRLRGVADERKI
jgi:hypothetical protein